MTRDIRSQLGSLHLRARKSLGQNFLADESVLDDIVAAAEVGPEDTVVEVGPGLGVLTARLAGAAQRVIAVELDPRLAAILNRAFGSNRGVTIVVGDILKLPPKELLAAHASEARGAQSYKVVANLPYYITSPVLRHFLEAGEKPSRMVVMVQKEVGEAIAAGPGDMSLLSVTVQFYACPSIVRVVPAASFYPAPKVDSVVLRLDVRPEPAIRVSDVQSFFGLVRCGFSARRKQLHNSLAHALGMTAGRVATLLSESKIDPQRRAESLSLAEWAIMYERFGGDADSRGSCQAESSPGSTRQAKRWVSRDTQPRADR